MKLYPLPSINSKYFNWKEFLLSPTAVKLNINNNPKREDIILNLSKLSQTLSNIRQAFGKPILINSGYRCPALNQAVGGHPKSYHQYGQAADIRCGTDNLTYELYLFCDLARTSPNSIVRKVILEKGQHYWVHIEID